MNKYTTPLLVFIFAFVLFGPPAFAWKEVRTGQRNFERAWQAYTSSQPDKANKFFKVAATAYAEALAADPPSRTARYASTLTMAGISFYYAGRHEECIDAMGLAYKKENKVWEANLFIGLSNARLGDKARAVEFLNLYLQSMPSQRILSSSVTQQLKNLETGSGSLSDSVKQIEKVLPLQFINNTTFNNAPRSSNPSFERCGGSFWWRKNKAPCSGSGYGLNSL